MDEELGETPIRVVDLDADTLAVLRAHRKAQAEERLAAGSAWLNTEGLIFTQADGSARSPRLVQQDLPRAREGVPLRVNQERLGHHDPAFTARQYQHVLPGMR